MSVLDIRNVDFTGEERERLGTIFFSNRSVYEAEQRRAWLENELYFTFASRVRDVAFEKGSKEIDGFELRVIIQQKRIISLIYENALITQEYDREHFIADKVREIFILQFTGLVQAAKEEYGRRRYHGRESGLGKGWHKQAHEHRIAATKRSFSMAQARKIGRALGVNFRKVSLKQFTMGLNVELEHKDVTKGNPYTTGRIALAHLNEKADYYTLLKKVEGEK